MSTNLKSSTPTSYSHILLLPDAEVLIIMVANEVQAENALYGEHGAVLGAHVYLDSPYYDSSF